MQLACSCCLMVLFIFESADYWPCFHSSRVSRIDFCAPQAYFQEIFCKRDDILNSTFMAAKASPFLLPLSVH